MRYVAAEEFRNAPIKAFLALPGLGDALGSARRPAARPSGAPGRLRRRGRPSRWSCAGSARPWRCPALPAPAGGLVAHQFIDARAGMPASSSQVANVWRKSWEPWRSTASSSGSRGVGSGDQRQACGSSAERPGRLRRAHRARAARWSAGRRGRSWRAGRRAARRSGRRDPQRLEGPYGGRAQLGGRISKLGNGSLVRAPEVVS